MKSNSLVIFLTVTLLFTIRAKGEDDTPLPTDDPKVVALYQACTKGDPATVKSLVEGGAAIDGTVGTGKFTSLMEAVYKDNIDIVKYLIDHHAKLDQVDYEGSPPLLHACSGSHLDCADALIDAGANVSLGSKYGRTPLMYAAQHGDDRIVKDLLDHKVALDANCDQGPALYWAACNDQLSTVKLLAEAGANLNLIPNGARPDTYSALGTAAANNDLRMVDYLISKNADVNGVGGAAGRTPLMAAADYKRTEAMERLLDHGAKADAKNKDGQTALMIACGDAKNASVRALLDHGVDPNVTDPRGETALTIAGDIGEAELVEMLKSKGALRTDVHIINKGDPAQPLSPTHAWTEGVAAIYTQRGGFNPKMLGGGAPAEGRRSMLQDDWGVKDKDSLLKELDDLRNSGHHAQYQKEGKQLAGMSNDQFVKLLADNPDTIEKIKAIRASYLKWKDRSGLAWDMCRSANLVNAGFTSKYLTEQEAWDRLMAIARQAQGVFNSWQEMSDNFLDGREMWSGRRDPHFEACAQLLLNPKDPNSPWNQNPWKTNLSGN
jgi:ankyrin repeat protein